MNILIDSDSGITLIIESAIYLFLLIYIKRRKKYSNTYAFFFSIFYVYICNLAGYTLFPMILSETMRSDIGQNIFERINITPLIALTINDIKTSFYNVLLTIPFGFGISFVTKSNLNLKKISLLGLVVGLSIEALQFLEALIMGFTFRVVDINDVIFNLLGAVIGYIVFKLFKIWFNWVIDKSNIELNSFLKYILNT